VSVSGQLCIADLIASIRKILIGIYGRSYCRNRSVYLNVVYGAAVLSSVDESDSMPMCR